MAKGDTMRHWLTILFISLTLGLSGQNPRQSITWLRAEDITNTRYFIWRGDTIDFTRFVDSLYVSITDTALFLATKNWVINNTVMMGDSINVYITPKQLRDSLGTLPGGHNPVTISQQGLNNGLSINNDQILTIRAASTSQSGALTSNDYNIFNNKLNAVTHDNTLTGTGTVANPLKVDTSRIASKSWVLNFKFLTQEYRDYDSLYNTPFIPEIKNDPFGVDWQNDVDNGASRNAIYNAITGLGGGGGATNLSYSAYTDKGIVNSDTGTDAEIPAGSTVNASLMLPEDKEFLDTVEDSITAHRIKINSLKLVNIDSSGFRITKNQITDLTVGSSKWDDDTYGITYTGNVGIGGASSAAEKLRVTHNSTNFAVDVYNSSSTGKGLQVRAGGTNHSILDLKNYTGTSRFSFSSNGKAKFSSYGQGNITGTVSKYLAVDSSGNIIEADGTDGGGGGSSQWTDQTYGIAYTAGNVGIGANPLTSAFLVRKSISGGSHMGVFDNTHSSQGHGLLVQLNHTSPSYNVLQISSPQGAHLLTVRANGDIRLQKYGKGSVTGTATKYLAVDTDGYLIEENIPQGGGGGTVTSVLAGNGMNFSTITGSGNVTLGTPSSVTLSSTNSVSATSHTHKFDPGGTSSQYIRGDGTLATMPQGGGDVYKVGTPVNNQVGVWTGNGTIEGDADLTFDGTNLVVTGNVTSDQNRTQTTLTNPSTYNYQSGAKARINLTADVSDMTITNLPDGSEGSLEVYQDATGNRTFTIAGSTGYTTLKRVGPKTEINLAANSHTTIAYWRTGDILYYGFVDDKVLSSSGGDNWGSQVVVTDTTLTGSGTTASPLSVVSSGGMTDPMTTAGDLIYRNSSNVTTRLPRGSNGQVLKATSTGIAWGTDGGSLWTDAGTHTYLSSTTDNLSIGSSSNNGFKLYVSGNGYFTTGLVSGNNIQGKSFSISEEQATITGTTLTEGGVFRVGTDNLAYWVSDYNDGNKVYDITGSTKPIKVSGTSRNLYINDHTFINTSSNPSGLENPIYLPASPHTGKIFVIVNRHTDDVRLRVGTSDVNYYTPSGTSNIVAGQSMVTIQFDGTNWYQIQ